MKISRPMMDKYLSLPGAPRPDVRKEYDQIEVIGWVGKIQTGMVGNVGDEIKSLRAKKLALECDQLIHEIQVEKGEFIPRADVVPAISKLWGELHALIRQKYEFELPSQYVGKNAIECAQLNIQALNLIETRFKAGQNL